MVTNILIWKIMENKQKNFSIFGKILFFSNFGKYCTKYGIRTE